MIHVFERAANDKDTIYILKNAYQIYYAFAAVEIAIQIFKKHLSLC